MMQRRTFVGTLVGGGAALVFTDERRNSAFGKQRDGVSIDQIRAGESIFQYVHRVAGSFDSKLYKQILGAANEFKEGDQIVGIAADNEVTRARARELLGNTRVREIDAHPLLADQLSGLLQRTIDRSAIDRTKDLTIRGLKQFLLDNDEAETKSIMPGLSSEVIGCVVKLMTNEELIAVGAKVFNSLPGSQIGAKGYLGARIQPNSPTDNLEDIRWQVFAGWAFAVGDVVLGNNPVSSNLESVAAIEDTLKDLLVTFGIDDVMPHCVLSHIDVQAEVENKHPDSTALWFQSIAGTDDANRTFDISVDKMLDYAASRTGPYGLYFETGQGADFTNGHGHGFDMVLHEARKYGFARALKQQVGDSLKNAGSKFEPWVHLNDVAGFIGPEVFRTREQLVRCCLEDIVMGKLHGLCIGLDVCSTLHMDVSLDDLDWCLDQIMPANPAYLMALPTKIDPMLGYLTTGYQDHVRLREKFGYQVNDRMWQFFQELEVIDRDGRPTRHFGDPLWIYQQYQQRKGDRRSQADILSDGRRQVTAIRERGVFMTQGHGERTWDLVPHLDQDIRRIYADAKESIWAELPVDFVTQVPNGFLVETLSSDREDYILHPESGERLTGPTLNALAELRRHHASQYDVQIVVSDGLNALSITDEGHLAPFLSRLRKQLAAAGHRVALENIIVRSGRVRAGYRIGEALLRDLSGPRGILHVIGERPGTGHHTYSIYITAPNGKVWGTEDAIDHNITKVVSGVATTALRPEIAADESVRILGMLMVRS
ncbi:MAG: ethanolamine ammonia-lyase subunit EutB [Planctomycetes bacterium]|nr:ethanolamine ammonia-lyase subunit EutB [Planctomycetota bacterium]